MKRMLRYFALLITAGLAFSSCQKELSAETGTAKGTIAKDANNNCSPATPNGVYKKDTTLTANNYVDIQVNITEVGIYLITTDTLNGYSFKASGVTAIPGVNTIRLTGFGKPLVVGTDVFTVTFDGSACDFAVNVLDANGGGGGGGTPVANFSFGSTAGNCSSTPNGIYAVNLPLNATNYVDLAITTISAGTYNLSTSIINGVLFSGNGTLATGATTIRLFASGSTSVSIANSFQYSITSTGATTSTCNFSINFLPTIAPATYNINCTTAATQTGTFQAGTAITPSSKITLSVTPTTTGSYNITTNLINGVSYIGIGAFTNTTTQNVDLFANPINNTPLSGGMFNYTTTGGTGACTNVSINYAGGGGGGASTDSISCSINNGAIKVFNLNTDIVADTLAPPLLVTGIGYAMSGELNPNSDELIGFGIYNATGVFPSIITTPLTYTVNQGPATIVAGLYQINSPSPAITFLSISTPPAIQTAPFTVVINSISGPWGITGTRVKGTFSGTLNEIPPATGIKNISNGYFDLTF
jgi:hypothetical protein